MPKTPRSPYSPRSLHSLAAHARRLPAFALAVLTTFTFLPPTPTPAQSIAIDKVMVVVNEEPITLSEYQTRHRREFLQNPEEIAPFDNAIDRRIMERMIDERIQIQIARLRGINVPAAEVERSVARVARQNKITQEQLLARLAQDGITPAQFRASIHEQGIIRRLVDSQVNARVVVSEREVANYLSRHAELLAVDDDFDISHLLVSLSGKTEDQVRAEIENLEHIRAGLLGGRDFADSVREFSDSPGPNGDGYLGWRKRDQLPELFVRTLSDMEAGGLSQVIRSEHGLHLLKLHKRRRGGEEIDQQHIRHILIRPGVGLNDAAARALAGKLRTRIQAGEDFATLARVHSVDRATGAAGGDIGWVSPGEFPPAFESALASLAVNRVSEPLRTSSGYHLVEIIARRRTDLSRELAARRARQAVFRRKAAELYDNWLGAIRDTAYIEYVSFTPAES